VSLEFHPTEKVVWTTFFASTPPERVTYEPNPTNERGPFGLPDRCLRISCETAAGKAYAFAWRTRGAPCEEIDDGTVFELFGANVSSKTGGPLLARVAKHLGVRLIQEYGGALLTEDGLIDSDIYDPSLIEKANAALHTPTEIRP
jgi:hypothetical protein